MIAVALVNVNQNVRATKMVELYFDGNRWEHEEILDDMRKRVKENKDVVKKRNCMCEHPFGTIKRGFNQGYLLLKGLKKVGGEIGLTMLAYNMRRVINILGMSKLMESMNLG